MDPLSVAAAVVGLLGAGAKISSCLDHLISSTQDVPGLALSAHQEVTDITAALFLLQTYISGQMQIKTKRESLILLEHVLTTLTGCVTTYSDLQTVLDGLKTGDRLTVLDKVKWLRHQAKLTIIVQRLQNHKSSMTLMLSILQCNSQNEAEASTKKLCSLVERVLEENQNLRGRIKGLEREGSNLAADNAMTESDDETVTIGARTILNSSSMTLDRAEATTFNFTFDQALQASRVYTRALKRLLDNHSVSTFTSTALYSTALSLFSQLSLSQISSISWYALPIYATDLSNSKFYIFGVEGAEPSSNVEDSDLAASAPISRAPNLRPIPALAVRQRRIRPPTPQLQAQDANGQTLLLRLRQKLQYVHKVGTPESEARPPSSKSDVREELYIPAPGPKVTFLRTVPPHSSAKNDHVLLGRFAVPQNIGSAKRGLAHQEQTMGYSQYAARWDAFHFSALDRR